MTKKLRDQIARTKEVLTQDSYVLHTFIEVTNLVELFFNYLEETMEKKMPKMAKAMKKVAPAAKAMEKIAKIEKVMPKMKDMKTKAKSKGC